MLIVLHPGPAKAPCCWFEPMKLGSWTCKSRHFPLFNPTPHFLNPIRLWGKHRDGVWDAEEPPFGEVKLVAEVAWPVGWPGQLCHAQSLRCFTPHTRVSHCDRRAVLLQDAVQKWAVSQGLGRDAFGTSRVGQGC